MLKFRLRVFEPWADSGRVLPGFVSLSWGGRLNAHPVLKVEVRKDSDSAALLNGECEAALEVNAGDGWFEPANCRFRSRSIKTDLVKQGATVVHNFVGLSSLLGDILVWDSTPDAEDGRLEFWGKTPGFIMASLIRAAKGRAGQGNRWGKGFSFRFDETVDSAGARWSENVGNAFVPTTPVFDVLKWLSNKGVVDWRMRGREFEMFLSGGGMERRTNVPLRDGLIVSAPHTVSYENLATAVLMRGENAAEWTSGNSNAESAFGRIEAGLSHGQVSREHTAFLHMNARLKAGERAASQYRRDWNEVPDGAPILWVDYQLGDWVIVNGESMRVVEAGVKVDHKGSVSGWETLGTRLDSLVERLHRVAKSAQDGLAGGENSPVQVKRGPDFERGEPRMPANVTVASGGDFSWDGSYRAFLDVRWEPVSLTVDGNPVSVAEYQVLVRDAGGRSFYHRAEFGRADIEVAPSGEYSVAVRALSKQNVWGAWSASVRRAVGRDTEAPPKPSKPLLSHDLGVLKVSHTGLDINGVAMPSDVARWEISVQTSATANAAPDGAVAAAGGLTWYRAGLIPGQKYWVRVRAVDLSENVGPWSDAVNVSVGKVFDDDALRAEIRDGTIIGPGAIKTPHLAALSVGADQLAVNAVRAGHMSLGALDGYILTGAVVQTTRAANAGVKLNADGLFAWDRTGRQTVSITANGGVIDGYVIRGGTLESTSGNSKIVVKNGAISILRGGVEQMRFNDNGLIITEGSRSIGQIYSQSVQGKPDVKGLAMNLDNGDFITWGVRDPQYKVYRSQMTLDVEGKFLGAPGLHIKTPLWVSEVKVKSGAVNFTDFNPDSRGDMPGFWRGNKGSGVIFGERDLWLRTGGYVYDMTEIFNKINRIAAQLNIY